MALGVLDKERKNCSFNIENFKPLLFHHLFPGISDSRRELLNNILQQEPDLYPTMTRYIEERAMRFNNMYKYGNKLQETLSKVDLSDAERNFILSKFNEQNPFSMHFNVFLPALKLLASDTQKEQLVPMAEKLRFLGCYAQTELGHGPHYRGIETTAEFDQQSQEFIMNTPTLRSYKWWVGGLGLSATHAIVIARLILNKKDLGIHSFFVPIRSTANHETLQGVTIGDVGPKFGNPVNDCGYMKLANVRIPRQNLLSRFSEVLETGDYHGIEPQDHKMISKFLIGRRIGFSRECVSPLLMSLTIAIRYSCVRKQFRTYANDPTKERPIIEYQMQQVKLFTLIAEAYAMLFASTQLSSLYQSATDSELRHINTLSLCYKAFFTDAISTGIETCRQSCGGHGFSSFSGVPFLYTTNVVYKSAEGTNSVLLESAASYLLKLTELKHPNGLVDSQEEGISGILIDEDVNTPVFHSNCLKAILNLASKEVYSRFKAMKEEAGSNESNIMNNRLQLASQNLASYFCNYHMHEAFALTIETFPNQFRPALETLRQIFGFNKILKSAGILLKNQTIGSETIESMRKAKEASLRKLRTDALGLVEAFGFEDEVLQSVLGRKDGEVYETLYKLSKDMNPINTQPIFPGIKQLIKPLSKL